MSQKRNYHCKWVKPGWKTKVKIFPDESLSVFNFRSKVQGQRENLIFHNTNEQLQKLNVGKAAAGNHFQSFSVNSWKCLMGDQLGALREWVFMSLCWINSYVLLGIEKQQQ